MKMKNNNVSEKKGSLPLLRRSARLSSPTYKSAAAPLLPEPSATTIRPSFQKKNPIPNPNPNPNPKPKPKPKRLIIDTFNFSGKWTQAEIERFVFEDLHRTIRGRSWYSCPGPGYDELTCIFPPGDDTFTWTDKSRGTTWIAMRGFTTYLVLAMDPDLDQNSSVINTPSGNYPPVTSAMWATLYQMGDPSSTFNQEIALHGQGKQRFPFAVVSIAPETFKNPQERNQASSRAIEFLKAKLFDCSDDLTFQKLVMIGIGALDEIFGPNFKSNQIRLMCYKSMKWEIGQIILSTNNVDKWLNEIRADPTRNVAEKAIAMK